MDDQPLFEQIDACRSGQDLSLPELADLAARLQTDPRAQDWLSRSQQFDARVAAVAHDVPVPAGLAERLLARLAEQPVVSPIVQPAGDVEPLPRRRWLTAVAALAASLLIAAGGLLFWNRPLALTAERLQEQAVAHFRGDRAAASPAPAESNLPASARIVRARRPARALADFLGAAATAYDYQVDGNYRATLYVVQRVGAGLPAAPPRRLAATPGGAPAAVSWQEGPLLYVLVVEGGDAVYQRLLRRSGPVA